MVKNTILRTLHYSDIFSFPLTVQELYYFLHTEKKVPFAKVKEQLKTIKEVATINGYYCLKGREKIIEERIRYKRSNEAKIRDAKKVASLLSLIPSILFIGLSGGVAAGSGREDEDIDFFIITQKNTLFTTRFFSLLLVMLLRRKRKRGVQHSPNSICLNIFLSVDELSFPLSKQDIYTAREIAQLYPLIDRDSTYKNFLKANDWRLRFLPHTQNGREVIYMKKEKRNSFLMRCMETPLSLIQLFIIQRHITSESVTKRALFFHPRDKRKYILDIFRKRLTQQKLL